MKYIILSLSSLLLFTGCMPNYVQPEKKQIILQEEKRSTVIQDHTFSPQAAVKKEIELKEVEDTNYNDAYMYPQSPIKKETVVQPPASAPIATKGTMGKESCIAMISQEKFDKYTTILGSETASIKRCDMISAMNR